MKILEKGTYRINNEDELIITEGCYFKEGSLYNSKNLVIIGGYFESHCLANSRRITVYGGIFEPLCFTSATDVQVINGNFKDSCFLNAKNIQLLGGKFGEHSFYNGKHIKGYSDGSIKSLANIKKTKLIIKTLDNLIFEKGFESNIQSVKIYAVNTKNEIKNHLIKISEDDFNRLYAPDIETLDDRIEEILKTGSAQ